MPLGVGTIGCSVFFVGRNRWSALVRGRPPRPASLDRIGLSWLGEERVQGDPRGPGGPPYCLTPSREHVPPPRIACATPLLRLAAVYVRRASDGNTWPCDCYPKCPIRPQSSRAAPDGAMPGKASLVPPGMRRARFARRSETAQPWSGSKARVFRIRRSSVPCGSSNRSPTGGMLRVAKNRRQDRRRYGRNSNLLLASTFPNSIG
jgi:hypothetical protein